MVGIPSTAQYQQLVKNYDDRKDKFLNGKQIKSDIEYFQKKIETLEKPDDIFRDPRLTKFLTSALNLAGEEKYPGKLRRILTERVDNEQAVLNRLSDKRYKQAAETLRLGEDGLKTLKLGVVQDKIIQNFKDQEFDRSIGRENPAVREALYFEKFAQKADSVWEYLGDPVLRRVVTRTLGIPERIAFQPLETQASVLESRIDVTKFQDKDFREKFIKRYLTQQDLANNATNTGAGSYLTGLFNGRGGSLNLFG